MDKKENVELFKNIRKRNLDNNGTKIILLDRHQMWSFNLKQNISTIFADPNYPKHYPNTVIPDYCRAVHAKYEVMQKAVNDNAFETKYFAWIDVVFSDI